MIIKANKDFILSGKICGYIFRQVNGKTVVSKAYGPKDFLTRKRPSYQKQFLEEAIEFLSRSLKNESVRRSYDEEAKSCGLKSPEAVALRNYIADMALLEMLYPSAAVNKF